MYSRVTYNAVLLTEQKQQIDDGMTETDKKQKAVMAK